MKKTLILISALSLLLGVSSCDNSILNHKGAVIVDKKNIASMCIPLFFLILNINVVRILFSKVKLFTI